MKKISIILILSLWFLISSSQDSKFPEAQISNEILTAHFYLPDINNGYYRATRFDWSGNTTSLTFKGHNYYGQWYDKYEPTIHDVVMGPVEEYGPVGFSDAKAGERFIKIGVGALTKLVFWSSPTTVCPEPYTDIKVEPGQRYSWKIHYEYYAQE